MASGGFADGRGLVAALALGRRRHEYGHPLRGHRRGAGSSEDVKEALVEHGELDTRLIMRTLRNTERVMHNPVVDKVLEIERKGNTKIEDMVPYVSGLVGKRKCWKAAIPRPPFCRPASAWA